MQRATISSERTPLVQPAYVFETSLSRSYQKRLRKFQCAICVSLLGVLAVALLVTISFDLSRNAEPADNGTEAPIPETPVPVTPVPVGNLTMVRLNPVLEPMLQLKWPLEGKPPSPWVGAIPSPTDIASAVAKGNEALTARKKVESLRKPLEPNSPANRAQKATATAATVKPLADAAYIGEQATRVLVNGTYITKREGGVGVGPSTNGSFFEPPYCRPTAPPCPPSKYRSVTGTCNNLRNPSKWGVASTPFRRVLPPDYEDGISSPRAGVQGAGVQGAGLPSARDVSVTVHRASYARDSEFTVMLAVWGQFIDHDITATALSKGENSSSLSCCDTSQPAHPECFPVKLDPEDPFYQDYNLTCMEFVRSAPAPTCHFGPREQLNQATAFLDGSVVYGFRKKLAQRLRTHVDGRLRMMKVGSRELLPQSLNPDDGCNTAAMIAKGRYCFESGDDRSNENLHLTTMHLIWARQHNRLATALKGLNPSWDDETLYQEARKIVGAQMQHITYTEFLPHVLGEDVMWSLNLTTMTEGYSESYDAAVDPSIANHFSAAAFRFAHTLLPGLIHNVDAAKGSLTYTRLHDILFNPYDLYGPKGPKYAVKSALDTPIHSADPHVTSELSNHLFEPPASNSSSTNDSTTRIPGVSKCGLDLVSLNIQRGRDHGLPSYPAWRELCGFPRPKTFDDLAEVFDNSSFSRISQIYTNVDDIDLYTGSLAEQPHGRLLGPTLTCLISDQFLRLKIGDRFWYENPDPVVGFSLEQLTEIRKTTLAGVICANEQLLDQIQPQVMREASSTNPLVDCMELLQPDLTPWSQEPATR